MIRILFAILIPVTERIIASKGPIMQKGAQRLSFAGTKRMIHINMGKRQDS